MIAYKIAGSQEAALDRLVDMCHGPAGFVADVVVLGDAAGLEERLMRAVDSGRLRIGQTIVGSFSIAITVHTGPHVIGMAWRFRAVGEQRPK